MLVKIISLWRRRAAAFVVVLYALCLVAPVATFALSDASAPCLSLTDDHHGVGESRVHHEGIDRGGKGSHDNDDHGLPGKCCGLFCVTAITPAFDMVTEPAAHASAVAVPAIENLLGRSSNRIDRPPRILASL